MHGPARNIAVSAVMSDIGLVLDLQSGLAMELSFAAITADGAETPDEGMRPPLDQAHARLAVIIHQRLWAYDIGTRRDAVALRERLRTDPKSICVVMLDETPLPRWLASAPCYDLAAEGRSGMIDFILAAAADAGARVSERPSPVAVDAPAVRWPHAPPSFLGQPRAYSALRHELTAIADVFEAEVERSRIASPERLFELHILPHRVIARMDSVALSVSWINGRQATVADGHLMVIAWCDVAADIRGVSALKFAAPIRERTYHAAGPTADDWCWRADDRTDMPYSSTNLAADWISQTVVARAH